MKDYKSQYMHPKWQKRRLEMLEAAGYQCQAYLINILQAQGH